MDPLTPEEVTALKAKVFRPSSIGGAWYCSEYLPRKSVEALFATIRDRERERDALTEALRDALSEVENTCYPTSKEKIAYLRDQKYKLPIVERERDDKEYARKEWAETAHRVIMERDEIQRKLDAAINSLKNVSMVARRERRTVKTEHDADAWGHIIRFCEEAGIKSSILRDGLAAPAREGEGGTE